MMKLWKATLVIAMALAATARAAAADTMAAYAPGVSPVSDALSLLFLAPVLLPTAGCVAALLWLICSDLRKARRSRPTPVKRGYLAAGKGVRLQPKIVT